MDKILKEQKFQKSGCTDSECAVEIGQLLNTDFIVIGSVSKFGSMYSLDARLIDVAKGKGLISAEFSKIGEIEVLMSSGITSIANQLCGFTDSNIIIEQTQLNVASKAMERGLTQQGTSIENRNLNSYNIDLQKQNPLLYSAGLVSALSIVLTYSIRTTEREYASEVLADWNKITNSEELYDNELEAYYGDTYEVHDFSGYTYNELEKMVNSPFQFINPQWLLVGGTTSAILIRIWFKKRKSIREKYNISFQPDLQNRNILLRFSYNL